MTSDLPFYVGQHREYGIGNFINCTPMLQTLSEHHQQPIPVHFQTRWVSQMFERCSFIESVTDENWLEGRDMIFSSQMTNQTIEDWRYIHQKITERLGIRKKTIPHTYVDRYETTRERPWVVILRGMVSDYWEPIKDPGDEIYQFIFDELELRNKQIIFMGADADYRRNIERMQSWYPDSEVVLNDMKKSLALINGADYIIGNDTGMYHAAGALNKHTFVLWKDTNFKKNKSPGKACTFSHKGNWKRDFLRWIKRMDQRTDG